LAGNVRAGYFESRDNRMGHRALTNQDIEIYCALRSLAETAPARLSAGTVTNMHDFNSLTDSVIVDLVDVRVIDVKQPPHNIGFRRELARNRATLWKARSEPIECSNPLNHSEP